MKTKNIFSLLAAVSLGLTTSPLFAVSVWNDTAIDFNDAGSWTGGTPAGDIVQFAGGAGTFQPDVSADIAIDRLQFSAVDSSGYDLTSSDGTLTLTYNATGTFIGTSAIAGYNTSGTNTISAPINLGQDEGITVWFSQEVGGTLVISGAVTSTNSNVGLRLGGAGSGNLSTIELSGASTTFAGDVTLGRADLRLGNKDALGTGTVKIAKFNESSISSTIDLSGANAVANAISLNTTLTLGGSKNLTLSGAITQEGSSKITANNTAETILSGPIYLSDASAGSKTLTLGGSEALTASGVIADNSGVGAVANNLSITNSNVVTLSGANTYTGTTQVSAGTLLINGNQSLASGAVTVRSGATLGGSGTVGGTTTIYSGATLAPGATVGPLAFSQDLKLNGGSTAVFQGGDRVDVSGLLTLSSNWNLTLTTGFEDGGSMVLFNFGSLGTFDDTPNFDITGLGFTPTDPLTLSQVGNSIVLNGISVVPEPTAFALLFGSLGLLTLLRRRRF